LETKGVLIAGVGGQGIVLAGDILCQVMMTSGLDVKKSEVHGMAQRGGSVTSHVRFGQKVYSPIAGKNDVDFLVSFEKMDTLRYLDFLKPEGMVIINSEEIYPPAVNLGDAVYPDNVVEIVRQRFRVVKVVDAKDLAGRAGNVRTVNAVLLGTLSFSLSAPLELWEGVLKNTFAPKLAEANLKAFHLGRSVR
jgi:indolepyruvate ferredoxin oxidoreductase beta subunit